jgi:hypothetical protein
MRYKPLILAAGLGILTLAPAASAQWTPGHPGDPRVCSYNRPAYCRDVAARVAFQAKYLRVMGRAFVGSLQCPSVAPLTYMCAWKTATLGGHSTVVRFAHKTAGWKASVGVIAAG